MKKQRECLVWKRSLFLYMYLFQSHRSRTHRADDRYLTDGAQQHELYRRGNGQGNEILHQSAHNKSDKTIAVIQPQEERCQQQIQENGDKQPCEKYSR